METLDCTRSPSKYKYPFSTRSSESFRTSRNTSRLKRKYMIRLKKKKNYQEHHFRTGLFPVLCDRLHISTGSSRRAVSRDLSDRHRERTG